MSGCSWCEAAEAQRQRETAGYKTFPSRCLCKAKELEVAETSPELTQEAQRRGALRATKAAHLWPS